MKKITVNAQKSVPVTPGMIGLFFEDINYNLDGGLHAEMIENRDFEALKATGDWDDYHTAFDGMYAWTPWPGENAACLSIHTGEPQNEVNPHYLHVKTQEPGSGFANKAYDGIFMQARAGYNVSFYARSRAYEGEVIVSVLSDANQAASASPAADAASKELVPAASASLTIRADGGWARYSLSLSSHEEVRGGRFVITLSAPGEVDFDFISMMPQDAVCGVFRRDLADKLKELSPGFLRFPGGCIIEGNTLENRYQWKKSIGPKETRAHNWNRWAVHNNSAETNFEGPYCHYGQTLGVGYYEYFLLCEYIGAKPLPVMNVGLACQYQSTQQVPIDSDEFQEFIQDALDLIEFANGAPETKWGAVRAEMGHPEPFDMDYIGIGNEQWQTDKVDFFSRYEKFEEAIHSHYPEMRLIGSAGPDVNTERYQMAWDWVHKRVETNPDFVYAVDEHYYVPPKWLYENVHFYDNYPRTAKVFAGEYAAHIPGKAGRFNTPEANSFEAALAEAAFLTGVERNADVVVMASYAPLMARLGYTQWSPDLIWFDEKSSYGTPSFYVQKLYSHYMGERSLETAADGEALYASATQCADGTCILKAVNASACPEEVLLDTGAPLPEEVTCIRLAADPDAVNSIDAPTNVSPVEVTVPIRDGVIRLPAYSFNVLLLK